MRHGHISKMHVRAERAETADRRARRPAPLLPAHPAGCTPGDHAGGRPASGSTPSARHRRKRGAVPQQPPLAPPTSPTPELAHMAVRLWPIDRPASRAESAIRSRALVDDGHASLLTLDCSHSTRSRLYPGAGRGPAYRGVDNQLVLELELSCWLHEVLGVHGRVVRLSPWVGDLQMSWSPCGDLRRAAR